MYSKEDGILDNIKQMAMYKVEELYLLTVDMQNTAETFWIRFCKCE